MKKYKLKDSVKEMAILIILLITALFVNKQLNNDFIDNCTENGNSESYCIAHS